MKFYNREKEIKLLANIQEAADENAQMVTLMGRRRIGKKPSHYCAVTL